MIPTPATDMIYLALKYEPEVWEEASRRSGGSPTLAALAEMSAFARASGIRRRPWWKFWAYPLEGLRAQR